MMEKGLEELLMEREAVTDDALAAMKFEKIDMAVIAAMTEENLKKYIPKLGDRIAVIRYCKNGNGSNKNRRVSLVERIRRSQMTESEINVAAKRNLDDANNKMKKPKSNERPTRTIKIGFIVNGTPVRERNGGGVRTCIMNKHSKKEDIIKRGLEFFFPKGISKHGPLYKFTYDLLDYKEHKFDDNFSIQDMYRMTGLTMLRFYLSATMIGEIDSEEDEEKAVNAERREEAAKTIDAVIAEALAFDDIDDFELSFEMNSDTNYASNNDLVLRNPRNVTTGNIETDLERNEINSNEQVKTTQRDFGGNEIDNGERMKTTQGDLDGNYRENDVEEHLEAGGLSVRNAVSHDSHAETTSQSKTIVVHRGQILKELIQEFQTIQSINTCIEIEIVAPNGIKESAYDGGGVFKDALTEFWAEFYISLCEGASVKVPEINPSYTDDRWKAVAKIILIGYYQVNYFPVLISRAFIEYAVDGQTTMDLLETYFDYIPAFDAEILKRALRNIDDVEKEELIDALSNLECKQMVNKDNIKEVLNNLAHTAIIQRPMFILDCWAPILANKLSKYTLDRIYEANKVNNKSVLNLIQAFDADLNSDKERVLAYVKKFIREANEEILKKFLRFCTGADIITCEHIQIEFNSLQGAARRPTAHTCSNILVVPVGYDSYRSFKCEFTNILKSNVWSMDIV